MTGRAFTSDLSGQEFWLVVDKGYEPLGLVLGNCVFSMGAMGGFLANLQGIGRGEVEQYSRLMYEARELALSRMQAARSAPSTYARWGSPRRPGCGRCTG